MHARYNRETVFETTPSVRSARRDRDRNPGEAKCHLSVPSWIVLIESPKSPEGPSRDFIEKEARAIKRKRTARGSMSDFAEFQQPCHQPNQGRETLTPHLRNFHLPIVGSSTDPELYLRILPVVSRNDPSRFSGSSSAYSISRETWRLQSHGLNREIIILLHLIKADQRSAISFFSFV